MRPRLLDLFCGAGGAAMGYHQAGFDVVGVDIKPQPNYPFHHIVADALTFMDWCDVGVAGYDVIHASPPCQAYIRSGLTRDDHPRLIEPTRERLRASGVPWVIENVPGAPIRQDAVLCGTMFGLEVRRHRWFETSCGAVILTPPCNHSYAVAGVYGNPHGARGAWPGMLPSDLGTWSRAMNIDWMTTSELAEAIPPAYTRFIGEQLLAHINQQRIAS